MGSIFSGLARWWQEYRKRRRYAALITPEHIGGMAKDLAHLAYLAQQHASLSPQEARHLAQLTEEMRHLHAMTEKTEFCRLPADRRLALCDSLQRSQEKLLTSIQSTQAPTARMQ